MKKIFKIFVFQMIFLSNSYFLCASDMKQISITGSVNNPLRVSLASLEKLSTSEVQLNEIYKNGDFKGVFRLKGIPLKDLLDLSNIEKKDTDFKKPTDVVIRVKNSSGQMVTLSWGEIYFKNTDAIMIATSSRPVYPHKGPHHFKDKAAYHQMLKILERSIDYPKLIVRSDFYADRALEDVTEVEVVDLRLNVPGKKSPDAFSKEFRITGAVKKEMILDTLPDLASKTALTHIVGEGRGYHGTCEFSGVSLKDLILETEPDLNLNTVFVISAPDAYRALISYGELFLNPHGERILVADKKDNGPIPHNGKFYVVLPDDLMADREVKAVCKIEIMSIGK